MRQRPQAIAVFDSGVGGLSVWREIVRQLPHEDTLYLADQAHVPYGPRPVDQIRRYCQGIARFFVDEGCKAIVVACNTASAAALKDLRESFPHLPVIGMEPAVKPAAALTQSKTVAILATPATFQGRLFKATAGRHASDVILINQVCEGLAEIVERGELDGPDTERTLRRFLDPVLAAGADTIVLACTHYPFVLPAIRRIVGEGVEIIDPAPAIARHMGDVLDIARLSAHRNGIGVHRFCTTGDGRSFAEGLRRLVAMDVDPRLLRWDSGRIVDAR
jgi:glutamate racemase